MRHGLPGFVLRRGLAAVLFVVTVGAGAFCLAKLAPGDVGTPLELSGASPEAVRAERARWGVDRSLVDHLGEWAAGLLRFDLGQSSSLRRPVRAVVIDGTLATARLAFVALILATVVGLPVGLLTGARPRGRLAAIVTPISVALISCPPIVAALVLLLVAVRTQWLSTAQGALALPALALMLPLAASLERLQSQATADVLAAPDLAATAARGVPFGRLLWVHVFRQALRPVLGIYGLVIGGLFSGSLAVEWVTGWPGLGRLTYQALVGRDLFLVAGCALAGAALIAAGNLVADLLRALADPRVRETR
ncbi:MAG: ABC transporter permease [Vicinamibacterales bacterium]